MDVLGSAPPAALEVSAHIPGPVEGAHVKPSLESGLAPRETHLVIPRIYGREMSSAPGATLLLLIRGVHPETLQIFFTTWPTAGKVRIMP